MDGFGNKIPPLKKHVIIYFIQKGFRERDALDFFKYYSDRDWTGKRNKPVVNWKRMAWNWKGVQLSRNP